MTTSQERIALSDRLREVLGEQPAATMMAMFPASENLATKDDVSTLGSELRAEMGGLRTEMAMMRQEMELRYATKDDLVDLRRDFETTLGSFVRTFISVQAASMIGLAGIVFAIVRLT